MKLLHVLRAVYAEPWLITPEMHRQISAIVQNHLTAKAGTDEDPMDWMKPAPDDDCEMCGDIAIIDICGVIGNKISMLEKSSGVCGADAIGRNIDQAMNNPSVNGIILRIDSPGGSVSGVPELCEKVMTCAESKPIMAFADGGMNSAAYYIGCGATAIYATQSASVGSIGVYLPILDSSRYYEMQGLKMEVFKTDALKGIGISGTELTDDQRAYLQAQVDFLGSKFKASVKLGRGNASKIPAEAMRGQTHYAEQALAANLIDGICDMGGVLREMQSYIRMKNK